MLQKRIKSMIEKDITLADVIQVMLIRRALPCQRQPLNMWGRATNPAAILWHDAQRDLEAALQEPEDVAKDV